ncbi:MAG TPA: ATP-binding protein [Phycisphaerae bacterium]|nr:ATP-binding protein [Phycisphaerae bacterium]
MLPESPQNINLPHAESSLTQHLDGLERRLIELQLQVERLQRLAALGTISAMLAHEFNNILTPIVSYCGYAIQRGDPDLMRTAVEKTHKNAQRLTTLCNRILGMAVDDQMGPTDTALLPLVRDAVECLGRDLEKDNIALSIDVPENLKAHATPGALQQVLFNLVINARQAMIEKGGTLKIVSRPLPGGRVAVDVTDTGCGIRPEHMEKIFEPFFTTKEHEGRPDRRGIGLGLHICKQLMDEQQGTITVVSKPGAGTTFTLTLPAGRR